MPGEPETTLSVEDAVAEMSAASASPAEEQEQAVVETAPEAQQEPVEGEAEAQEGEAAQEAEPAPEEPAIEAPKSWSAEDREAWATLTPEAQKIVAAREADRDRTVSKALSEKDRATKQANQDAAAAAADFRSKAEAVVPEALRRVTELEAVDLVALNQRDPHAAQQILFEREQARADYDKLQADIQSAQRVEYQAHVAKLVEDLPTLVPDLVDPEKGAERVNAVGKFLSDVGIPQDQIRWVSATELALAYDAMRWRQSQDKARTAVAAATRPSTPPTRPVRPAGSAPASSQQSAVETAKNRLAKSGGIDDAVALLQARRSN